MSTNNTNSILDDLKNEFVGQTTNEKLNYAQELIPLVDVRYGMYVVKGRNRNRYLKMVRVLPTNYNLKEPSEQNNIIATFAGWLHIAPDKGQLKIITENELEIPFVETLRDKWAVETDETKKEIMNSLIRFIEHETEQDAPDTKYYLIFEYEPQKKDLRKEITEEYIAGQLANVVAQAREFFSAMGNEFARYEDENLYLGEFLYAFLNRTSATKYTFRDRAMRILGDVKTIEELKHINREYPDTDYVNLISPMGVSLKSTPDCIIADKTYYAYYYITSAGYPLEVNSAWLTEAFAGIPGIDIDVYYRKLDKSKFLGILTQMTKLTVLKAHSRTAESADAEDVRAAFDSQTYLRDALTNKNNPQDPYNIATIFTVRASTYEDLKDKCDRLEEIAKINSIGISDMRRFEWEGMKATLPFNDVPPKIWKKARRNITTEGLAGFYPFTAYKLNDPKGIFIGMNTQNKTICTFDPSNTAKYSNANMVILGASGTGKTYSMALFAARNVLLKNQVFIITSEKPHEFQRLCDKLNGKFVRFGGSNNQFINRYDINPLSNKRMELYGETEEESWLTEKLKSLSAWYELLFREITEEELIVLDRATKDAYYTKGITNDNDSIYVNNDPSSGKLKEMPIISDVITALENQQAAGQRVPERLFTLLKNFSQGTYAGFNEQTNVNLDRDFFVFDISKVPERIEAATIQAALDFIWCKVKEDPTVSKTIVIEEGWKYLSRGASEAAAKQIQEIFKTIRGYGGSVILATQEIDDIFSSEYGRSLVANSSIKMLLGVEEGQSETLRQVFRLQPYEAQMLESFTKGACLLMAGKDHLTVQIQACPVEHMLITTDRNQLMKMKEERDRNS